MNRNRRTEEIGITAPVPKGAWAAWTTYQQLNIVSHNGAAYIAKSANSNVEPGVTSGWDSYWMLLQVSDEIEVDDTLSKAGEAADAAVVGDKFAEVDESLGDINDQITQIIEDINYVEIAIESFTNSVGSVVEIGRSLSNIALAWSLNKAATALTLDGNAISASEDGTTIAGPVTSTKTWTLVATDERGATASATTRINFYNGVYYGVGVASDVYDSDFILAFTRVLRGSKLPQFEVNAGADEYIYYCLPASYGNCTFTVGGFTGGFELVATLPFTNASGYEQSYNIYRSVNADLGDTVVNVS